MLYKRLIINGKEYLLAVSQAGSGAPAATDPGSPGILYMDTDTGDLYKCSGGEDGAWAWKKLSEGGSGYELPIGGENLGGVKNGGNVTINADGTMTAPEAGSIKITGTENSKIAPTGTILDNGTEIHLVSQEIRVNPGEQYLLTCSANFGNSLYAIYDSNGVMKENLTAPATKEGRNEVDLQVTIPSNGAILRVAWNKQVTDTPYAVTKVGNAVTIPKVLDGVTVAVIGDSLVEKNNSARVNFVDILAAETGATITNLGVGGTGYMAGADESKAFYQRAAQIPEGTDRVLIYGSGNDRNMPLGNPTDTGTDTLCGCINATIDAVYERVPTAWVGIIAPAPWKEYPPYGEKKQFELMVQAQQRICARRGIPFLDLYHASGLRPWDDTFRELAFDTEGVHPNDTGHALIAPQIQAFLLGAIGGGAVASVPDSSQNGEDGFSPIATVTQTEDGATITITDKTGTTTATVTNGNDGTTPHIGENGNWWIGETDTGVSAGGTGGETWELIKTMNFTEDTYSIDPIETDNDGNPFELTAYQVISRAGDPSGDQMFRINPQNDGSNVSSINSFLEPTWHVGVPLFAEAKIEESRALVYRMGSSSILNHRFAGYANRNINQIAWSNLGSNYIKAGSIVEIWGVRV